MDTFRFWLPNCYIRACLFDIRSLLPIYQKNLIAMESTPGFEHSQLRGITIKNMIVTVACTATLVISLMTAYSGLKSDNLTTRQMQDEQNKILELRIRIIEDQQKLLSQQIRELQDKK